MFKVNILFAYERFLQNTVGPFYRGLGQRLFQRAILMQDDMVSDDRVVRQLTKIPYGKSNPSIEKASFIAPNSVIIGSVDLQESSSIWYGSTLRGDTHPISIGRNTVIQDNVHLTGTQINNNVYVGPNSTIGKCQIDNNAFIGMGSVIRNGSVVKGIVAAGSIVQEGEQIGEGQIFAGSPAKYLRDITPEELQILKEHKQEMRELSILHAEENNKSFRDILDDIGEIQSKRNSTLEDKAYAAIAKLNFPIDGDDEEFIEHRVFLKDQPFLDEKTSSMQPYEADLSKYPECIKFNHHYIFKEFKLYQEDYDLYEKAKRFFEENPTAKAEPAKVNTQIHPTRDGSWKNKI